MSNNCFQPRPKSRSRSNCRSVQTGPLLHYGVMHLYWFQDLLQTQWCNIVQPHKAHSGCGVVADFSSYLIYTCGFSSLSDWDISTMTVRPFHPSLFHQCGARYTTWPLKAHAEAAVHQLHLKAVIFSKAAIRAGSTMNKKSGIQTGCLLMCWRSWTQVSMVTYCLCDPRDLCASWS